MSAKVGNNKQKEESKNDLNEFEFGGNSNSVHNPDGSELLFDNDTIAFK